MTGRGAEAARGLGPADGQAVTTVTPAPRKAATWAGSAPTSVMRTSTSARCAKRTVRSTADLAGVREYDDPLSAGHDRGLRRRLHIVGRGETVVDRDAVGADERHLGPDPCQGRDRLDPHGGLGGVADAPGQEVQLDVRPVGEPGGDRDRMGERRDPVVLGSICGQLDRRRPCVEDHRRACGGHVRQCRLGDPPLLLGVGQPAVSEAVLEHRERVRRKRSSVHPA